MSDFEKSIIAVIILLIIALACLYVRLAGCEKCKKNKSEGQKPSARVQKIRLAIIMQNTILLVQRKVLKSVCMDIPFEVVLNMGETVEHGLRRMLYPEFGEKIPEVRFCLKYACNERSCVSDNFLFIVHCDDDVVPLKGAYKPWTRRQIESNIGKGVFCSQFEDEYKHLRLVVDTWEMFK